ncbi:MAG: helix-turn-helix domain-containing protein [Acidobacteriota bacterium]|nr:helix-turn-helix domain-containing protein [Acidobacteriota bacterium]
MARTEAERDPVKVLGATIRRLRKAKRLTQNQLGALAEMHGNYVGLIERGERNISALNICYLAAALEVSPSELWQDVTRADLAALRAKSVKRFRKET